MVTVTGTENLLMAATLAEGETVLENAAQEPEIPDLAELLIAMGAQIEGHGTQPHPHPGRRAAARRDAPHRARPHRDRHLPVRGGGGRRRRGAARRARRPPRRGDRQAARGRRAASRPATTGSACSADGRPKAVSFRTSEYPAFPTDMQAQFMALNCIAEGTAQRHRDDLREPLHARQRAGAPGREDRGRRPHGGGAGRASSCRARP